MYIEQEAKKMRDYLSEQLERQAKSFDIVLRRMSKSLFETALVRKDVSSILVDKELGKMELIHQIDLEYSKGDIKFLEKLEALESLLGQNGRVCKSDSQSFKLFEDLNDIYSKVEKMFSMIENVKHIDENWLKQLRFEYVVFLEKLGEGKKPNQVTQKASGMPDLIVENFYNKTALKRTNLGYVEFTLYDETIFEVLDGIDSLVFNLDGETYRRDYKKLIIIKGQTPYQLGYTCVDSRGRLKDIPLRTIYQNLSFIRHREQGLVVRELNDFPTKNVKTKVKTDVNGRVSKYWMKQKVPASNRVEETFQDVFPGISVPDPLDMDIFDVLSKDHALKVMVDNIEYVVKRTYGLKKLHEGAARESWLPCVKLENKKKGRVQFWALREFLEIFKTGKYFTTSDHTFARMEEFMKKYSIESK